MQRRILCGAALLYMTAAKYLSQHNRGLKLRSLELKKKTGRTAEAQNCPWSRWYSTYLCTRSNFFPSANKHSTAAAWDDGLVWVAARCKLNLDRYHLKHKRPTIQPKTSSDCRQDVAIVWHKALQGAFSDRPLLSITRHHKVNY